MSSVRIERLLEALTEAVRSSGDQKHAGQILESALSYMNSTAPAVAVPASNRNRRDALGAPISARLDQLGWDELRTEVRSIAKTIGWSAPARRYGSRPEVLRDLVYRRRDPGPRRQARVRKVIEAIRIYH